MSRYKVLVDSSVWIQYFRYGDGEKLSRLIEEDLVCTNELIFTEIAPILIKNGQNEVLDGLKALEFVPLIINWEGIRNLQLHNLNQGINKIGIPDLIILQQVIDEKLSLYTLDKHFKLMQKHVNFDLYS
ncbi:MAG TPA: PIN domain nuclease [Bacteroidetes bacterium]|nr:PIN domain nuclease [Bacteroidota bacterium]